MDLNSLSFGNRCSKICTKAYQMAKWSLKISLILIQRRLQFPLSPYGRISQCVDVCIEKEMINHMQSPQLKCIIYLFCLRVGFFPGVQVFPKSNLDTSKTLINFSQNIIGAEVFLFHYPKTGIGMKLSLDKIEVKLPLVF